MVVSDLEESDRLLIDEAMKARQRSFAPYSGYFVGACLRTSDGRLIHGCNVENVVLAETCCAEKVAIVKAVSEGDTDFDAIGIVTTSSPPAPPCGSCRQLLFTWGVRRVVLANDAGEAVTCSIEDLLPRAFALTELPASTPKKS